VEQAQRYNFSTTVMFKEIQEQGYEEKVTILRYFLQTIRKKKKKLFSGMRQILGSRSHKLFKLY